MALDKRIKKENAKRKLYINVLAAVTASVVLTTLTVLTLLHVNNPEAIGNASNSASQSLAALEAVRKQVDVYWDKHRRMPQYISLKQLGVDPQLIKALPAIRSVRMGGHAYDKKSTYIQADIRNDTGDGAAGHSVIMTINARPKATSRGRATDYHCYIRGPNGAVAKGDLKHFPGICQNTAPDAVPL